MNVTLSLDDQLVSRAREKAAALGKSLDQLVSNYLKSVVDGDDSERAIGEFEGLSGRGHSHGRRFDRDEIHERRTFESQNPHPFDRAQGRPSRTERD